MEPEGPGTIYVNSSNLGATWRKSTRCGSTNCVEVAMIAGDVAMRDSADPAGPVLRFSAERWTQFLNGASAGEFDL